MIFQAEFYLIGGDDAIVGQNGSKYLPVRIEFRKQIKETKLENINQSQRKIMIIY